MKTKYILHGGYDSNLDEEFNLFYQEILRNTPDSVKILLVHFASPEERNSENYQRDTNYFLKNKGDKKIIFEVATENGFIEQIRNSDVVYLGGGITSKLVDALKKFKNLKKEFEGKIVAGESAGANCVAVYGYSKAAGSVIKGMGIIPVFMIPHYKGDENVNTDTIPSKLERVFLPNYKFRVFEI